MNKLYLIASLLATFAYGATQAHADTTKINDQTLLEHPCDEDGAKQYDSCVVVTEPLNEGVNPNAMIPNNQHLKIKDTVLLIDYESPRAASATVVFSDKINNPTITWINNPTNPPRRLMLPSDADYRMVYITHDFGAHWVAEVQIITPGGDG